MHLCIRSNTTYTVLTFWQIEAVKVSTVSVHCFNLQLLADQDLALIPTR